MIIREAKQIVSFSPRIVPTGTFIVSKHKERRFFSSSSRERSQSGNAKEREIPNNKIKDRAESVARQGLQDNVRHMLEHSIVRVRSVASKANVQNEEEQESVEYLLVYSTSSENSKPTILSMLRRHRNILFGAQVVHSSLIEAMKDDNDEQQNLQSPVPSSEMSVAVMIAACGRLVDVATTDAGENGDQVQALSTLRGLCAWVSSCLAAYEQNMTSDENNLQITSCGSQTLDSLMESVREGNEDSIVTYDAIKAIATGQPRPGHSVLGAGTYRDGRLGWEALAREYASLQSADDDEGDEEENAQINVARCPEVELYRSRGAELVAIEHLADTSKEYLQTAGGAMGRFFFM